MGMSKKAKAIAGKVDAEKFYGIDEALATLKEFASKKFDETVEVAMNLGVDPRHADQMVRGMVSLPAGTGKEMKVAVFAKGDKADEELKTNFTALVDAIVKAKPAGAKGKYVQKVSLTSTMGPGLKVDLAEVEG